MDRLAYDYWASRAEWTAVQAVLLVSDRDPAGLDDAYVRHHLLTLEHVGHAAPEAFGDDMPMAHLKDDERLGRLLGRLLGEARQGTVVVSRWFGPPAGVSGKLDPRFKPADFIEWARAQPDFPSPPNELAKGVASSSSRHPSELLKAGREAVSSADEVEQLTIQRDVLRGLLRAIDRAPGDFLCGQHLNRSRLQQAFDDARRELLRPPTKPRQLRTIPTGSNLRDWIGEVLGRSRGHDTDE